MWELRTLEHVDLDVRAVVGSPAAQGQVSRSQKLSGTTPPSTFQYLSASGLEACSIGGVSMILTKARRNECNAENVA